MQVNKKIGLRKLQCTKEHVPLETVSVMQSIFNRAGDYAEYYFGHPSNGHEVAEFFRFQPNPRISELAVYEIVLEQRVSTSAGLVAVAYFPELRQSYISLVVLDRQYYGMGVGAQAVALVESMLEPESQFVSVKVNIAQHQAVNFWKKQGFVAEGKVPSSMNPVFTCDENHVRLVKQTSRTHFDEVVQLAA